MTSDHLKRSIAIAVIEAIGDGATAESIVDTLDWFIDKIDKLNDDDISSTTPTSDIEFQPTRKIAVKRKNPKKALSKKKAVRRK